MDGFFNSGSGTLFTRNLVHFSIGIYTLEDIAEANTLMKHILLKKSDELGYATRNFLERLKSFIKKSKLTLFTNKEIRQALKENPNTQKKYMAELQQYGYVRKKEGDKKKGFTYEIVSLEEYNQLKDSINHALDGVLDKLSK